ncbi:MAG: hypothetical protein AAF724_02955, partial [Pseudomonadota bacterium]
SWAFGRWPPDQRGRAGQRHDDRLGAADHEIILANGAASETYVDVTGRQTFDNHQDYLDLYGAERTIEEMERPRISAQRLVPEAIKRKIGIVEKAIS